LAGHYLGVVAILAEIAGFWQVYAGLQPAGERVALPFLLVNAAGAAVGAIFHASFVFVALTAQAQQGTTGATYQAFAELLAGFNGQRVGLVGVAGPGIVIGSIWYAFTVG
jgi:hypothetical protein